MILSIISAIGNNNEIGKNNSLLWNLPIDMKHFKETTSGHPIIMGQRTFESIGRALPNRRNIVLTKDKGLQIKGVELVYSSEELIDLLEKTEEKDSECFIIGGAQIYKLFIEQCDRLYITHVDASFSDAGTFLPDIDKTKWKVISENKYSANEKNIYNCNFVTYEKIK